MENDELDQGPRKKFAQTRAQGILKDAGIVDAPVSLQRVIEHVQKTHDVAVVRQAFGKKVSGMLVRCAEVDKEYSTIGFRQSDPWCRRRFTIAHEFGHLLMEHDGCDGRQGGSHNEKEANAFASELLMPTALIKRDMKRGLKIPELAALYRVSAEAMSYKLMAVGAFA